MPARQHRRSKAAPGQASSSGCGRASRPPAGSWVSTAGATTWGNLTTGSGPGGWRCSGQLRTQSPSIVLLVPFLAACFVHGAERLHQYGFPAGRPARRPALLPLPRLQRRLSPRPASSRPPPPRPSPRFRPLPRPHPRRRPLRQSSPRRNPPSSLPPSRHPRTGTARPSPTGRCRRAGPRTEDLTRPFRRRRYPAQRRRLRHGHDPSERHGPVSRPRPPVALQPRPQPILTGRHNGPRTPSIPWSCFAGQRGARDRRRHLSGCTLTDIDDVEQYNQPTIPSL